MNFGMIGAGLVMGIAAIGSAIGIGIAGQGAIGAWKRCFMANKPAPLRGFRSKRPPASQGKACLMFRRAFHG